MKVGAGRGRLASLGIAAGLSGCGDPRALCDSQVCVEPSDEQVYPGPCAARAVDTFWWYEHGRVVAIASGDRAAGSAQSILYDRGGRVEELFEERWAPGWERSTRWTFTDQGSEREVIEGGENVPSDAGDADDNQEGRLQRGPVATRIRYDRRLRLRGLDVVWGVPADGRDHWLAREVEVAGASAPAIYRYEYDERSMPEGRARIQRELDGEGVETDRRAFHYDGDGHMTAEVEFRGVEPIEYAWEGDRLIGDGEVEYMYDRAGNRRAMRTGDGELLVFDYSCWDCSDGAGRSEADAPGHLVAEPGSECRQE
jgi:hypothetical protein